MLLSLIIIGSLISEEPNQNLVFHLKSKEALGDIQFSYWEKSPVPGFDELNKVLAGWDEQTDLKEIRADLQQIFSHWDESDIELFYLFWRGEWEPARTKISEALIQIKDASRRVQSQKIKEILMTELSKVKPEWDEWQLDHFSKLWPNSRPTLSWLKMVLPWFALVPNVAKVFPEFSPTEQMIITYNWIETLAMIWPEIWTHRLKERDVPISDFEEEAKEIFQLIFDRLYLNQAEVDPLSFNFQIWEADSALSVVEKKYKFKTLELIQTAFSPYQVEGRAKYQDSRYWIDHISYYAGFLTLENEEKRQCFIPVGGMGDKEGVQLRSEYFVRTADQSPLLEQLQEAINSNSIETIRLRASLGSENLELELDLKDLELQCLAEKTSEKPQIHLLIGKYAFNTSLLWFIEKGQDQQKSIMSLLANYNPVKRGRLRDCSQFEEEYLVMSSRMRPQEGIMQFAQINWESPEQIYSITEVQISDLQAELNRKTFNFRDGSWREFHYPIEYFPVNLKDKSLKLESSPEELFARSWRYYQLVSFPLGRK